MLGAALIFAVLDGLIKLMGPTFRVWDIAFLRWGGSLALLIVLFGRQGKYFKTDNLKLMVVRSVTGFWGLNIAKAGKAVCTLPPKLCLQLYWELGFWVN
jgi:hypothetical protein